jgi:hypothetical protein
MPSVSLIDGHIDRKQTNYDRIRNMSVEEMAKLLAKEIPHGDCYGCKLDCCNDDGCVGAFRKWLESEVEGE